MYNRIIASCWLHRSAYSCSTELVRGDQTCDRYLRFLYSMLKCLTDHNVKPIFIFDGNITWI